MRPQLKLIALAGILVPRRLRSDWRQEWEAELHHREELLAKWHKLDRNNKVDLVWRSTAAFGDALCLLPKRMEDEMFQDLRYGVRLLIKNKSFTAVAILSLALGIGANTAIFQLIDAVRLRTLPVKNPQELAEVRLENMRGARGGFYGSAPTVTNPIWEQIRARQQGFSGIFAWGTDTVNLAPGGAVRPARMLYAGGAFFSTLRLQPALGRFFTEADDQRRCTAPGLVISHAFWQREYAGLPDAVGRTLTLSGQPFEIVGVTPASFFGMEVGRGFDLALPLCANPLVRGDSRMLDAGTNWWLTVTGRLKPGWSLPQATAQLLAMSPGLFETTLPPGYPPVSVKNYLASTLIAVPAGSGVSDLRDRYEQSLWLLLAIGGLVLLIACANLANLLLARASARQREIAVRQSLGASRGRLIRQLLIESLLLAVVGAALGAGLAPVLSGVLVAFIGTRDNPVFLNLTMDWHVLGFATGLAVLTALLFGLAPAIRTTRTELVAAMKTGSRGSLGGSTRFSLRRALVIAQVALSLVLVAGAILFTRSLGNLLTVDTGFRQDGILVASMLFQRLNLPADRYQTFGDEILQRVRTTPGVESAAISHQIPLRGGGGNNVWLDGADARQAISVRRSRIGPDYFATMQIPLLAGRDFNGHDTAGSPKVAIVNQAFSRQFLNGANPVGRRFWVEATPDSAEMPFEIVGMVGDTKYGNLREDYRVIVYDASAQESAEPGVQLMVRSHLPPTETVEAIKRTVNSVSPAITINFRELSPLIEATVLRERLVATLSGFFGVLALTLACIGLYGLLSYSVASRTNEIGIRMALGARKAAVFWLVLREALILVSIGLAVGVPLTFTLSRLAASLLFRLTPTDPLSLLFAVLAMLAVAMLGGYLPSRGAARLDPMVALRRE